MNKLRQYLITLLMLACLLVTTVMATDIRVNATADVKTIPDSDKFNELKKELSSAAMVRFDILITVESSVFDEIDSTYGDISVANDGRYFARLNGDEYLYDGKCIYEYSAENNQVTKRCPSEGEVVENRLGFIKNLDKYYKTTVVEQDSIYTLAKIAENEESLPDSMTIYLKGGNLARLEYYDLNDDLNKVDILSEAIFDSLKINIFELNLPDSVEVIILP
jgi:outer membrane lipoprotein-sorting protein